MQVAQPWLPRSNGLKIVLSRRSDPDRYQVMWITLALFLSYLCVAMSLPVTSLYVSSQLELGNALAGLAVGITFVSTILTRSLAGRLSDHHGGKYALVRGLWVYGVAGLICLLSGWHGLSPVLAYAVLIVGRLLLGLGESMALVGLLAWGFGIMGPQRSGRVIALVGMGMYGAFAAGGPLGLYLFEQSGVIGVMTACALVPLLGLAMVLPLAAVKPAVGERPSFWRIIGQIWQPGLVVCLQGVGFAAIGAFIPLLFLHQGWPHAGLGLTCFGAAFVLMRVLFGHLPDRVGGIPVAMVSMAIEAAGQYLLWSASSPEVALVGAFLTGLGCSMIFPAMGVEVVRRIPPHLRGTAMGGFAAFQDLAYGLTGPVTGLLADHFGYGVVFLVGGLAASLGLMVLLSLAKGHRELAI
jgi:MFS family permease